MTRFETVLKANGRKHETYRDADTLAEAARLAAQAWYSGATVEKIREGSDLYGCYVEFTARHPQSRIPAAVQIRLKRHK